MPNLSRCYTRWLFTCQADEIVAAKDASETIAVFHVEEKAPDDSNATIACDDVTKFMQVEEVQPMVVVPKDASWNSLFSWSSLLPLFKKGLISGQCCSSDTTFLIPTTQATNRQLDVPLKWTIRVPNLRKKLSRILTAFEVDFQVKKIVDFITRTLWILTLPLANCSTAFLADVIYASDLWRNL